MFLRQRLRSPFDVPLLIATSNPWGWSNTLNTSNKKKAALLTMRRPLAWRVRAVLSIVVFLGQNHEQMRTDAPFLRTHLVSSAMLSHFARLASSVSLRVFARAIPGMSAENAAQWCSLTQPAHAGLSTGVMTCQQAFSYRISDGQSRGFFALIHCPTSVSLSVSLCLTHACTFMSIFKSLLPRIFSVVVVCCFFGFVLAPFQETLPNAAQADLCISCMNGGSTRAKNFENSFHKQASKRSTLFNLW